MANSSTPRGFQLEQAFIANPTNSGAGAQVLASSYGFKRELLTEFTRAAYLPPPPLRVGTNFNDAMPTSFGIFRGETVDYIMARAQRLPDGTPVAHYLPLPAAALRWLAGNLVSLVPWIETPIAQTSLGDIQPYRFEPVPPDYEAQNEALLALMRYTGSKTAFISNLFAGMIQAMGVGVLNAPPSLVDRLLFVQGLLMLLPVPARVAITFATSVGDAAQVRSQFKFFDTPSFPPNFIVFDWANRKIIGDAPDHVYSKFIVSQLRLDTSVVVEHTEKLGRTAQWRAYQKDDLANALAWLSRRATLDSVVLMNQPADSAVVASVLREDPTLPDDLRLVYARHLMTFALAMKDPAHTEIIPSVCAQNREVSESIYSLLETAATKADTAQAVFDIVEQWVLLPPLGVDSERWRPLLGLALQTRHAALMKVNDSAGIFELMDRLVDSSEQLGIERSIVQIISSSYQRAYDDGRIASKIFMLTIAHLPINGIQRILSDAKYMAQLPSPLQEAVAALNGTLRQPRPEVLRRASASFGQDVQPLILGRLVEWAYSNQRFDLLDSTALKGMIGVAASPHGIRFEPLILSLAQDLSRPDVIRRLPPDVPPHLIAMQLARGRYQEAVNTLQFFQDNLFKATEQWQLAEIARIGMREAPLSARQLLIVLEVLGNSQLRTLIKLSAYVGALDSQKWSPEMEPAARALANYWVNDPRLIALLGIEPALRLLQSTANRRDRVEALRLVGALVEYALALGSEVEGTSIPELFTQVYIIAGWSPEMVSAITSSLCVFVRRAPLDVSGQLADEMTKMQGANVTPPLYAALRARYVIGGDNFLAFAEALDITAELLIDLAAVYHDSQEPPPLFKLRRSVQGAPGGMTESEKRQLGVNFQRLATQIMALFGQQQTRNLKRSRSETDIIRTRLFSGGAAPTTGLEALWWLGGHFSQGQQVELNLVREAQPHLFGIRTLNILVRETDIAIDTLRGLLAAFPERASHEMQAPDLDANAWSAEIDSVWAMLTLADQRQVQDQIGSDAQLLMRVIQAIGAKGNDKALLDAGLGKQLYIGKQQPRNVIDVLRWLAGFFADAHE